MKKNLHNKSQQSITSLLFAQCEAGIHISGKIILKIKSHAKLRFI